MSANRKPGLVPVLVALACIVSGCGREGSTSALKGNSPESPGSASALSIAPPSPTAPSATAVSPGQSPGTPFDQTILLQCCGVRRILAGAVEMMRLDRKVDMPELTPAVLQELVAQGYMQKIHDDPGQGPGTSRNFYMIPGHSLGVSCKVHGTDACAAHLAPP